MDFTVPEPSFCRSSFFRHRISPQKRGWRKLTGRPPPRLGWLPLLLPRMRLLGTDKAEDGLDVFWCLAQPRGCNDGQNETS